MAQSLLSLANLYRDQEKYAEAEAHYQRALAILEKALGPEHPGLAPSLDLYSDVLRKMGRAIEAEKMEARAQAIRAAQNPPK